ncbi:hypothetical protein A9K55_000407 [Cordyceps militaris]|uniref:Carbohydrate-binding module family 19 domain-containing protein n=1 Tax=Cordyceps militaris TaxID=73501 RepID=A0A2H4SVD8_CORMI|nr:hypothetical protein A9K55_000407 [Cordyceps militaris]
MKLLLTIAALLSATAVSADISDEAAKCKPSTYRCSSDRSSWDVCNTSRDWVFAGSCPRGTVCFFNEKSGSPYCL